jgi:hypothetical protein
MQSALCVLLLFMRGITVLALAGVLYTNLKNRPYSVLAAWLLLQLAQDLSIQLLSAFGALSQASVASVFVSCQVAALFAAFKKRTTREFLRLPSKYSAPYLLLFFGWAFVLLIRNLMYTDLTWDAQAYGLPRLALWKIYRSVFTYMPTEQLNIFSNEWNGELNALAYGLFSGSVQGYALGGFEVLLVLLVSLFWLFRLWDVPRPIAFIFALFLASAPAVVGLSCVTKGDLLACLAFAMLLGSMIRSIKSGPNAELLVFGCLAGSLAVGAKISTAFGVVALLGFSYVYFLRHAKVKRIPIAELIVAFLGSGIFLARYVANYLIWGNPFQRIEKASFSVGNLVGNAKITAERAIPIFEPKEIRTYSWALSSDWGVVFAILLVGFLFSLLVDGKLKARAQADKAVGRISGPLVAVLLIIVSTAAITLASIVPAPWTMRYFLPFILPLVVAILAWLHIRLGKFPMLLTYAAVLGLMANSLYIAKRGEIFPGSIKGLVSAIRRGEEPADQYRLFRGIHQNAKASEIGLDQKGGKKVLLLNSIDSQILPFFGKKETNKVRMVADERQLESNLIDPEWDVVAITKRERTAGSLDLCRKIIGPSAYTVVADNPAYLIAIPRRRVKNADSVELEPLRWSVWNFDTDVAYERGKGSLSVSSKHPVDSGYICDALPSSHDLLIQMRAEGRVNGEGTFAAHLSVLGSEPLIRFPSGEVSDNVVYSRVLLRSDAGKEAHLVFGLGGMTKAEGRIELRSISIQPVEILD